MGGKAKPQTIGYHYKWAMHLAWADAADAFLQFVAGSAQAWQGRQEANGVITINKPNLWGGESGQGGIRSDLIVQMGGADQAPSAYLGSTFGPKQGGNRGLVSTILAGGRYGAFVANPKPLIAQLERINADSLDWLPNMATIGATLVPQSKPDWRYKVVANSDATDYSSATYDDSAWASGPAPFADEPWAYPGTFGFATTPATVVPEAKKVWMRTQLVLDNVPASLRFEAFVDNDCIVYFNGVQVLQVGDNNGAYYDVTISDTSALHPGTNSIVVVGWDRHSGPGNFFYFDWRLTSEVALRTMNPAHIIYDALFHPKMLGHPESLNGNLDLVAAQLLGEGWGLCTMYYPDKETIQQFIDRVCDAAGLQFNQSRVDGKFYLDPIRGGYDLDSLPVITDDDILDFKAIPLNSNEVPNAVRVKYKDQVANRERTTAAVVALGRVRDAGRVITEVRNYPEIPIEALALRAAQRDCDALKPTLTRYELSVQRKFRGLRPGHVFRLQSPKNGIDDAVLRLGEIRHGTLRSGAVRLVAALDVFDSASASTVGSSPGEFVPPSKVPAAALAQAALEAPYVELVASLSAANMAAVAADAGYLLSVAQLTDTSINYALATAAGAEAFEVRGHGDACPTALIVEAAPLEAPLPASFTLSGGSLLDRVAEGSWALWGDEIVRVDAIDATALTVALGRACADTVPQAHAAGDRIWFAGDWVGGDAREYVDGETVKAKILPRTSQGELDVGDATELDVVMAQRWARPYAPANVLLNDEAFPAEVFGNLQVTFVPRDRLLQADQLVDFGMAGVGPEAGTTYTLEIYDTDTETLAYSEAGITTTPAEVPAASLPYHSRLELYAVRDGLESWQRFKTAFIAGIVITGGLPGGALQETYSQQLTALGATAPVTWSISAGSLPAGLAFDGATTLSTVLSGIPTATGYASFTVTAIDALGRTKSRAFTVGIGTIKTLLHLNGANGSTTFTDATGRVWTRGGNTVISTAQSKFGGASAFFDGNADSLTTPYTADWNFNAGDWSIDFYAYMTGASGGNLFGSMFSKRNSGADCDLIIYNSGQTLQVKFGDTSDGGRNMGCGTFLLNTLYRVTVGRKGTKLYCAVNGVIRNSLTISGSLRNRSLAPELGKSLSYTDSYFKGYIDEFKLITGAALFADDQPGYLEAQSDYPVP